MMTANGAIVTDKQGTAPWWLGGDELCAHCCQPYVLEAECRCTECDGALCMHCAVVVQLSGGRLCPECRAAIEADGRD